MAGLNSDQGYNDTAYKTSQSLRGVVSHATVPTIMIRCTSSQKRMFSKWGCRRSSSFALRHEISPCMWWYLIVTYFCQFNAPTVVPCGICIALTSSHVNVSAHNPTQFHGIYERIQQHNSSCCTARTLQLIIVEVWLYIISCHKQMINCLFYFASWLWRVEELQLPAD